MGKCEMEEQKKTEREADGSSFKYPPDWKGLKLERTKTQVSRLLLVGHLEHAQQRHKHGHVSSTKTVSLCRRMSVSETEPVRLIVALWG